MRIRVDPGKAIMLFVEKYLKAKEDYMIEKPVSYALYSTWRYIDSIEKSRKAGIDNN